MEALHKKNILRFIPSVDEVLNQPPIKEFFGDFPRTLVVDLVREKIGNFRQEILFDADSIVFGEELEPIVQFVELPEEQKRYSIESQTSDLLNELECWNNRFQNRHWKPKQIYLEFLRPVILNSVQDLT